MESRSQLVDFTCFHLPVSVNCVYPWPDPPTPLLLSGAGDTDAMRVEARTADDGRFSSSSLLLSSLELSDTKVYEP